MNKNTVRKDTTCHTKPQFHSSVRVNSTFKSYHVLAHQVNPIVKHKKDSFSSGALKKSVSFIGHELDGRPEHKQRPVVVGTHALRDLGVKRTCH